jgi:serine/threonine-protein kinase
VSAEKRDSAPGSAPAGANFPLSEAPTAPLALGADPNDPILGRLLDGRYRVLEPLAEGGMGKVYRAEHLGLRKQVALKLVQESDGSGPDHAQRFMREALLTSRIDHPNVISAMDYGTFGDGTAYLAMSLVSGPTLSSLIESESGISWLRAAEIGAQIADAAAAAQSQSIVHRDLKPENVIVQQLPDGGELVKVLDFGIAKFARDSLAPPSMRSAQKVTRVGTVVGTPGYMAPEQAIGMRADHRSDLYSIGVILWECVVGHKLWDQEDVQQLLAAQLSTQPPTVREATGDDSIPEAFDQLVAQLLSTRAQERPDSATEVRDILRLLVSEARQGWHAVRARAPARKSPAPAPAAAKTLALRPHARELAPATANTVELRERSTVELEEPLDGVPEASIGDGMPAVTVGDEQVDPIVVPLRRPLGRKATLIAAALLCVAGLWIAFRPSRHEPSATAKAPVAAKTRAEAALPGVERSREPTAPAVATASASEAREDTAPAQDAKPTTPAVSASGHHAHARAAGGPSAKSSDAEALRARARELFGAKKYRDAANAYELAIKQEPKSAGSYAGLGACLLELGDARGASARYQRAVELSPGSSGFQAALGRSLLVAGDDTRALAAYRKARELDPNNQAARTALARLEH